MMEEDMEQASVRIYVLLNVAKVRRSCIENFRVPCDAASASPNQWIKGMAENPKPKTLADSQLWKKCMQRILNLKPQKENIIEIKNTIVQEAANLCALRPESFLFLWLLQP